MTVVAIADDHPLVSEGLCALVDAQDDMTLGPVFSDGGALLDALPQLGADVLVLDLSLPGATGLSILERLRETAPRIKVVVYSMYSEEVVGRSVRAAGAFAFLSKRRPPSELLAAVHAAASGRPPVPADERDAPHALLSARQLEIFLLVCEGCAPGDLCRRLDLSPSTVSSHLAAVRRKLGVETNGEILLYALQAGLLER